MTHCTRGQSAYVGVHATDDVGPMESRWGKPIGALRASKMRTAEILASRGHPLLTPWSRENTVTHCDGLGYKMIRSLSFSESVSLLSTMRKIAVLATKKILPIDFRRHCPYDKAVSLIPSDPRAIVSLPLPLLAPDGGRHLTLGCLASSPSLGPGRGQAPHFGFLALVPVYPGSAAHSLLHRLDLRQLLTEGTTARLWGNRISCSKATHASQVRTPRYHEGVCQGQNVDTKIKFFPLWLSPGK